MTLVRLQGDYVSLHGDKASPPGTRLRGVVDGGHELALKVHRCVRSGERFAIEGRLISPTRGLRRLLEGKLSESCR